MPGILFQREIEMVKLEMDMPKSCWDCKFRHKKHVPAFFGGFKEVEVCYITGTDVYGHGKTRSQDCPLKNCEGTGD